MSSVSVHHKEESVTNELMVIDLVVPYATLWHSGESNTTRLDIHLKLDEAQALNAALTETLKGIQMASPSVDR